MGGGFGSKQVAWKVTAIAALLSQQAGRPVQLLHDRDLIQQEARRELRFRFAEFDIELVDVLIGKPDTAGAGGAIETLLEQLRLRQLAREQVETYEQQRVAAEKLLTLKTAQALAEKQTELTNSKVEVEIAGNRGDAKLALARKADAFLLRKMAAGLIDPGGETLTERARRRAWTAARLCILWLVVWPVVIVAVNLLLNVK